MITAGRVPDKFKINETDGVLAVISENWNTGPRGVVTVLETFSISPTQKPVKLGSLQLAQGEQLHAARFDGNRVYVVTFYRVDPLWIVDLSNPAAPAIVGELQVPGWSTYIQPLGDRLVTIGVNDTNDWRVAVSLFDVHDATKPALLSKVPLGVNYSWSEATYDEKAFAVLPDDGLILVPYQGYETNGYASRVQLIDLGPTSLAARGTIEHAFQPRRATLSQERIYSISGKELLTVDAADRDHPSVRSDLELSWSVDRVFLSGDYVLELANGNNWYGWWSQDSATPPSIRVSKTSDPDHPVGTFLLTSSWPVAGATLQDGKLYVAQAQSSGSIPVRIPTRVSRLAPLPSPCPCWTCPDCPASRSLAMRHDHRRGRLGTHLEPNLAQAGATGSVGRRRLGHQFSMPGRSEWRVWQAEPWRSDGVFRPWWGGNGGRFMRST